MPKIEVTNVAPYGLGYGEGTISFEARKEEVGTAGLQAIEEAIFSDDILMPVDMDNNGGMLDDDGCGDGRNVSLVFVGDELRNKSLTRPKVFGGGATMAAATLIGLDKAKGQSIRETFSDGIARMNASKIDFGAHTDGHAEAPNCGCGAIDKAPAIVQNAIKYKDQIQGSIEALGVDVTGLDEVFSAYADFVPTMQAENYAGAEVIDEIQRNRKVVKELDDNHKEMVIILGMAEGYVINQEKIRQVTDNKAQAFAVAVWRAKQIADRLYAGDSAETRHKAFLSELVYTLATAATLTKGDLPVYVLAEQPPVA